MCDHVCVRMNEFSGEEMSLHDMTYFRRSGCVTKYEERSYGQMVVKEIERGVAVERWTARSFT